MKEGYFYFIPVSGESREPNRSLGYLSVSKAPAGSSYSVQCSLNQNILKARGTPEIYLSSAVYADSESVLIGKMTASGGARLFMDSYVSVTAADSFRGNLYAVVSFGGRTLCYSILNEEHISSPQHISSHASSFTGAPFDPFETTNPSYKWFIYDNRENVLYSVKNMQELDKLLKYYNVSYGMFAKLGGGTESGTFLKMAYYAIQVAGHLLRGEYADPETGRHFTVIGLPGWNTQMQQNTTRARGRKHQYTNKNNSAAVRTIRECSRWIYTKVKPPCSYGRSYNGYWLYYFDAETGLPVKAIMKN